MHHELKHRAHQMGIAHKVLFAGFIDDVTRNSLYNCGCRSLSQPL